MLDGDDLIVVRGASRRQSLVKALQYRLANAALLVKRPVKRCDEVALLLGRQD
jgi:hypothetical protein